MGLSRNSTLSADDVVALLRNEFDPDVRTVDLIGEGLGAHYAISVRVAGLLDFSVERSLVHCDLINRNVFVHDAEISGVLDWGCSIYGDFLYELAPLIYWSPWYPRLDLEATARRFLKDWESGGEIIPDSQRRLRAALIHVGIEHIAYHAFLEDWESLAAVERRLADFLLP